MPYYKIKTNRFAEWKMGDIAAIDDEAARVALEKGEIELVEEEQHTNALKRPMEPDGFVCKQCGKICKSAAGLKVHLRSHK